MVNKYIPQGDDKHSEVDVEMYLRSSHITKRVKGASIIETQCKQVNKSFMSTNKITTFSA